jgi:hypothetical protein
MNIFKHFNKPKLEIEVRPRAAYDCRTESSTAEMYSELVYPSMQPYVDRGCLLASVLNDVLATELEQLGPYDYEAHLEWRPRLLKLYSKKVPEHCRYATPHLVATISASAGITWGWAQPHSKTDPVLRGLKAIGCRDDVPELSEPAIQLPAGWPPRARKAKNDALAVLAHQIGMAAIGMRLSIDPGDAAMTRHYNLPPDSSYTLTSFEFKSAAAPPPVPPLPAGLSSKVSSPMSSKLSSPISPTATASRPSLSRPSLSRPSLSTPITPISSRPPMPASLTSPISPTSSIPHSSTSAYADVAQASPYFVAPRYGNYAVFLLDFGPSVLHTQLSLAEVAPSIRRMLSNGPPVKDQREAFRGLAAGMGWDCKESTVDPSQPDFSKPTDYNTDYSQPNFDYLDYASRPAMSDASSTQTAHEDTAITTMNITDGFSILDVTFDSTGRMTNIKMQLDE